METVKRKRKNCLAKNGNKYLQGLQQKVTKLLKSLQHPVKTWHTRQEEGQDHLLLRLVPVQEDGLGEGRPCLSNMIFFNETTIYR
jgi:hypothetical protein